MPSTFDSYRSERIVDFDSGWGEVRRIRWSQPAQCTWQTSERCYLLMLMLVSPSEVMCRNEELAHIVSDGSSRVLLIPPGQTMCTASFSAGAERSLQCFIDADLMESVFTAKPGSTERAQFSTLDLSGGAAEWLLFRMYREISRAEPGMAMMVESIAREIAVEFTRTVERQRRAADRHAGGLASWRMRLMLERIYAEGPLPTVNDLAEICGVTARHLGRAFHAETGKTLGKFIGTAMAERATGMLKAGTPVGAVAAALGYANSSSFSYAFRQETGVLPSNVQESR